MTCRHGRPARAGGRHPPSAGPVVRAPGRLLSLSPSHRRRPPHSTRNHLSNRPAGEPGTARSPARLLTPFGIALGYFIVSATYIFFSDRAVAALVRDPALHTRVQTFKGFAFIGLTALLLWALIRASRRAALDGERIYRQMFERTGAVALLVDPSTGRIVDANAAATRFYGWSRSELAGKPVADINTASPAEIARMMTATRELGSSQFLFQHRTASGQIREVELHSGPIDVGNDVLLFSIIHDLTARVEAERALELSEDRYRTLMNEAADAFVLMEIGGRFVEVNPKACELSGYGRDELLARSITDLITPDNLAEIPLRVDELRAGRTVIQERTIRRRDGRATPVEVSARMVADGRIQAVIRDVSERHRLAEQLRQAQKMEAIGQLAGGIAHDLNNVLGVVLANAGLLRDALPAGRDDLRADLGEIEGAAKRGASMIGKLMSFSRQAPLAVTTVELGGVVDNVVDTLRRLLPTSIAVVADRVPAPVVVRADPVAVEQILLNLATNARDAMPAGGSLRVRVSAATLREGPGVPGGEFGCFTVSDDGAGMSEEVLARIFEPFFTTKPPSQGTGLGMAMVYGLVRQQGGTIAVRSAPGAGTTVRVCLPAAQSIVAPHAGTAGGDRWPRGTETILFVEDEAPLRRAGTRILERLGYTVMTAADGEEALDVIRHDPRPIDLVISDIVMPRLSGHGLFERVRHEERRVRFLFSSGYGGEEIAEMEGDAEAVAPLLRKPWSAEELATRVRELLDQPL